MSWIYIFWICPIFWLENQPSSEAEEGLYRANLLKIYICLPFYDSLSWHRFVEVVMGQSTCLFLLLTCFKKGRTALSPVFVLLGLLGERDASWERGANTSIMRIRSVAGCTCNANTLKFVSKEGEVSSPFTTREWVFLVWEMLAIWSNHVYRDFLGCSYWSSIDWAGFLAYFPKGLMFQSHNTLLRKA